MPQMSPPNWLMMMITIMISYLTTAKFTAKVKSPEPK